MKSFKKIMSTAFTLIAFCFLFANVMTVSAEEKIPGKVYVDPYWTVKDKLKNTTKLRVVTEQFHEFKVEYGAGDKIKNLKVNKKGMSAAVTYSRSENSAAEDYGYSEITLYATKPGKYKVSFNVVGADGKKVAKKSVTVQAVNGSGVIKKVTFGKQTVLEKSATLKNGTKKTVYKENFKVKGSSGKMKVTPNSQYKITGMVVVSLDKNGKEVYKKIKNGGTVTLSKEYDSLRRTSTYKETSGKKWTYIYISYKDTFFGDTCTYSVSKRRGVKEVKRVYKDKLTGWSSVSYYQAEDHEDEASFSLWQY